MILNEILQSSHFYYSISGLKQRIRFKYSQKNMAPEFINEETNYTEKVNVYSLGVLIYFVLNKVKYL